MGYNTQNVVQVKLHATRLPGERVKSFKQELLKNPMIKMAAFFGPQHSGAKLWERFTFSLKITDTESFQNHKASGSGRRLHSPDGDEIFTGV